MIFYEYILKNITKKTSSTPKHIGRARELRMSKSSRCWLESKHLGGGRGGQRSGGEAQRRSRLRVLELESTGGHLSGVGC